MNAQMFSTRLIKQSPTEVKLLALCARGDREAAQRIAAAHPEIVPQLAEGDRRQLIHAAWTGRAEDGRLDGCARLRPAYTR